MQFCYLTLTPFTPPDHPRPDDTEHVPLGVTQREPWALRPLPAGTGFPAGPGH